MQTYGLLAGLLVVVILVAGMRWQYGRVMDAVTDPDPDAYQLIPVTTPIVKPICSGAYNGADCLRLP